MAETAEWEATLEDDGESASMSEEAVTTDDIVAAEGERVMAIAKVEGKKMVAQQEMEDDRTREVTGAALMEMDENGDMVPKKKPNLLDAQLTALDRHFDSSIERWNSPQDFSKVDLVCAELIKKGGYGEALKYMERVKKLVDTLTGTLRVRDAETNQDKKLAANLSESSLPPAGTGGSPARGSRPPTPNRGQEAPRASRMSVSNKQQQLPPSGEDAKLRRELAKLKKENKELKDSFDAYQTKAEDRLDSVQKKLEAWQQDAMAKEKKMISMGERIVQHTMVQQTAVAREGNATKKVDSLQTKIDGLTHLLNVADQRAQDDAVKVQHMRQKMIEAGARDREMAAREAKLAGHLTELESMLEERDTQLRATSKAANMALAKQDAAIKGLNERVEQQALELQRRDEILHALGQKLQANGQTIVEFLTPGADAPESRGGPTSPGPDALVPGVREETQKLLKSKPYDVADWGATTGGSSRPGTVKSGRPTSRQLTPGSTTVSTRPGSTPMRSRMPTPAISEKGSKGRPALGQESSSSSLHGTGKKSKREAEGGIPIRISENEGHGAAYKPWVIHQPIRCEPAAHFVVIGVPQFQSVEMPHHNKMQAVDTKLCSCGELTSKFFELSGHVVWRGRTAVIGPPLNDGGPKFRSVLGLEMPGEGQNPAFS